MVGMSAGASPNFSQTTPFPQRVVKGTRKCIAHEVKCIEKIAFTRTISTYQIVQSTQSDIAIRYAFIIPQDHTG